MLFFQTNILTLLPVLCWTIVTCILPSVFPVENKTSKDVEQLFCTGSLSPETALVLSLQPGLMPLEWMELIMDQFTECFYFS